MGDIEKITKKKTPSSILPARQIAVSTSVKDPSGLLSARTHCYIKEHSLETGLFSILLYIMNTSSVMKYSGFIYILLYTVLYRTVF